MRQREPVFVDIDNSHSLLLGIPLGLGFRGWEGALVNLEMDAAKLNCKTNWRRHMIAIALSRAERRVCALDRSRNRGGGRGGRGGGSAGRTETTVWYAHWWGRDRRRAGRDARSEHHTLYRVQLMHTYWSYFMRPTTMDCDDATRPHV